ncbi:MAG TPA: VWA-like domain-containing protein [Vicinamibacterales bacterium]
MLTQIAGLMRAPNRRAEGYSRDLQTARLRASYQRAYFAPALYTLIPVKTELIASMAVDAQWRLYYNEAWLATHTVEENASLLIHEVSHLLRDHEARKKAAAATNPRLWNTAADCEINDDLAAEGLPLPGDPPHPQKYGMPVGSTAEIYYQTLSKPDPSQSTAQCDCGSGADGERRAWELPPDEQTSGGTPGVDAVKADMVRRDVAQKIMDMSGLAGEVPLAWRRWAHSMMTPRVDYMAIIRRTVRTALRESTLGRYDRTYRHPHRRQACYGEFIMPSFYQPRPRPGFLIDTSGSMQETQLSRAITELGALTRQLGRGNDVLVACCDAAVQGVKKAFNPERMELLGGGGTDLRKGLDWFSARKGGAIDLLIIVTDCETAWPDEAPPFPVVTIRVGNGLPPPWGDRGANKVITIEDREQLIEQSMVRKRRWWLNDRGR